MRPSYECYPFFKVEEIVKQVAYSEDKYNAFAKDFALELYATFVHVDIYGTKEKYIEQLEYMHKTLNNAIAVYNPAYQLDIQVLKLISKRLKSFIHFLIVNPI